MSEKAGRELMRVYHTRPCGLQRADGFYSEHEGKPLKVFNIHFFMPQNVLSTDYVEALW